jgi:hypothetical protein
MTQSHKKSKTQEFVKFRIDPKDKEAVLLFLVRTKTSLQRFGQDAFREHLRRMKEDKQRGAA